ncbi:MAG: type 1 glutamine amidotransferase domain-containing protein [Bacteriovorax sp.]|nr:type 1 glutamine amidotransferase domain-containing protein [Bacteriovorax sp.]
MKKILIVASSTDTLELKDNKKMATGYYLDELAVPAQYFIEAGYAVVIATPHGNKPIMDENSNKLALFDNNEAKHKAAVKFVVTNPSMQKPKTLKEVSKNTKDYVAVYVPGGHAPMNDLMQDPDLGKILRDFHKEKKVTAFLCHGPVAALASLPKAQEFRRALVDGNRTAARELAKNWQYAGYNMTVFSDDEEKIAEKEMKGEVQFFVADALTLAGGYVENAAVFKPLVVQDRELITGQNPASDLELAKAVVKAIVERKTEKFSEPHMTKFGPEEHTADL